MTRLWNLWYLPRIIRLVNGVSFKRTKANNTNGPLHQLTIPTPKLSNGCESEI